MSIPVIGVFFKLFPDTNFNTEIPDMTGKFRACGNPILDTSYLKPDFSAVLKSKKLFCHSH